MDGCSKGSSQRHDRIGIDDRCKLNAVFANLEALGNPLLCQVHHLSVSQPDNDGLQPNSSNGYEQGKHH